MGNQRTGLLWGQRAQGDRRALRWGEVTLEVLQVYPAVWGCSFPWETDGLLHSVYMKPLSLSAFNYT